MPRRPRDRLGDPWVGVLVGDTWQEPPPVWPSGRLCTPGGAMKAFGEGEACTESMPESPACRVSQYRELRRSVDRLRWLVLLLALRLRLVLPRLPLPLATSTATGLLTLVSTMAGNTKDWPSASPRGESCKSPEHI